MECLKPRPQTYLVGLLSVKARLECLNGNGDDGDLGLAEADLFRFNLEP